MAGGTKANARYSKDSLFLKHGNEFNIIGYGGPGKYIKGALGLGEMITGILENGADKFFASRIYRGVDTGILQLRNSPLHKRWRIDEAEYSIGKRQGIEEVGFVIDLRVNRQVAYSFARQ